MFKKFFFIFILLFLIVFVSGDCRSGNVYELSITNNSGEDVNLQTINFDINTIYFVDNNLLDYRCLGLKIYDSQCNEIPFYIENYCYDNNTSIWIQDNFHNGETKHYFLNFDNNVYDSNELFGYVFNIEELSGKAKQGIASSENYFFTTNTNDIYKFDRSFNQLKFVDAPFGCATGTPDHLGDLEYFDGNLYIPAEHFNWNLDINSTQILVYDSNLNCLESIPISQNDIFEIAGIAKYKDYWVMVNFHDPDHVYFFNNDFSFSHKLNLNMNVYHPQGIDTDGNLLYISALGDRNTTTYFLEEGGGVYVVDPNTGNTRILYWNDTNSDEGDGHKGFEEEGIDFDEKENKIRLSHEDIPDIFNIVVVNRPYDGNQIFHVFENFADSNGTLENYDDWNGDAAGLANTDTNYRYMSRDGKAFQYKGKVDTINYKAYLHISQKVGDYYNAKGYTNPSNLAKFGFFTYTLTRKSSPTFRDYIAISDWAKNRVTFAWYRYTDGVFEYWDSNSTSWHNTTVSSEPNIWHKIEYHFDSTSSWKVYIDNDLAYSGIGYRPQYLRLEGGYSGAYMSFWSPYVIYRMQNGYNLNLSRAQVDLKASNIVASDLNYNQIGNFDFNYVNIGNLNLDQNHNVLFYVNNVLDNNKLITSVLNVNDYRQESFTKSFNNPNIVGDVNLMFCTFYYDDLNTNNDCNSKIIHIYYSDLKAQAIDLNTNDFNYGDAVKINVKAINSGDLNVNANLYLLISEHNNQDNNVLFSWNYSFLSNNLVSLEKIWDVNLKGDLDFNLYFENITTDLNHSNDYNFISNFATSYYSDLNVGLIIEDVNVYHTNNIICNVKNIGNDQTYSDFNVKLYIDNNLYDSNFFTSPISSNSDVNFMFSWTPNKANYDINCIVNYNDVNSENNFFAKSVSLIYDTNVDLSIENIILNSNYYSDVSTATCVLKNNSDENSVNDYNVLFYVNNVFEDYQTINTIILANNTNNVIFNWIPSSLGDYNIKCIVDYNVFNYTGFDKNLDNNVFTKTFSLLAHSSSGGTIIVHKNKEAKKELPKPKNTNILPKPKKVMPYTNKFIIDNKGMDFNVNNVKLNVYLYSQNSDSVQLAFDNAYALRFKYDKDYYLDVDFDGVYDLQLKVKKQDNNKVELSIAHIKYKYFYNKTESKERDIVKENNASAQNNLTKTLREIKNNKSYLYLFIGLVLILIFIIILIYKKRY